ncbi:MAG: hypothetical protein LUD72_09990, partial [Bacteroidales bacterium]|nr:hypothetical protein [Bacteroidales bacterium]
TFSSLSPNTVYQYAVIAVYDDLSGDGTRVNYFYTNAMRTEAMVLFDNVSVTKTGVSFEFSWAEGYDDSWLHTKFTLETNGVITGSVDPTAREIDGLLSDTEYTLNVAYTGVNGETESIRLTFTTLAMEAPEISISSLTATKTEINYAVAVTDADEVVKDVTVSLAKDGKEVESKEALSGTFDALYSGSEYIVTVTYTYNLNDGQGDKTSEEARSIFTTAMSAPKIYSFGLDVSKTEISYSLVVIDGDGTGSLTSVSLSRGDLVVGSSALSSGSFTGLFTGCTYTLTATYTYDLNDGYGERQLVETSYVTTEAVSTPKLEIYTFTSTTEEITYEFVETDKDDVGDITSITLYRGAKEIYTATEWAGTFSELLSDNEYTLVATYEYDLGDGEGVHSVEVTGSIYTKAKTVPTVSVYLLTSTKDSVSYDIVITDKDGVVASTSVVLSKGSKSWTADSVYGTFTGLLSDNEYTLTIEVTYDLGDGWGMRTTEVTRTIYTQPVAVPVVEAELTASKEGIDYALSVSDEDGVMTDISVTLYKGSEAQEETSLLTGSFPGLLSDNDYTVKVIFS